MNKLFAIIIMCSLSLPVLAIEGQEAEIIPVSTNNQEAVTTEEIEELAPNTESINTQSVPAAVQSPYKEPVSKKKLAMKFLIAMLCVAGTSLFLYITLSIYNKFRDTQSQNEVIAPEGEKPLDTPADLTDAVKSFVEKTKWTE